MEGINKPARLLRKQLRCQKLVEITGFWGRNTEFGMFDECRWKDQERPKCFDSCLTTSYDPVAFDFFHMSRRRVALQLKHQGSVSTRRSFISIGIINLQQLLPMVLLITIIANGITYNHCCQWSHIWYPYTAPHSPSLRAASSIFWLNHQLIRMTNQLWLKLSLR